MPRWGQVLIHCALLLVNFLMLQSGIPKDYSIILGGLQLVVGYIAQAYNTDGTDQRTAYTPNNK